MEEGSVQLPSNLFNVIYMHSMLLVLCVGLGNVDNNIEYPQTTDHVFSQMQDIVMSRIGTQLQVYYTVKYNTLPRNILSYIIYVHVSMFLVSVVFHPAVPVSFSSMLADTVVDFVTS